MSAINKIHFLMIISFCYGVPTTNRQCLPDRIDFDTKVANSSIVVYGKAMAKIDDEKDHSKFVVYYQVDCILKGPPTLRHIEIKSDEKTEDKEYCQEFFVSRGYSIVFLEPISSNTTDHKTFTPTDFTEIHIGKNLTNQLVTHLCNLHPTIPLQSVASVDELCPPIIIDPACQETVTVTIDIIPTDSTTTIDDVLSNENAFTLQSMDPMEQEMIAIQNKPKTSQINVDQKSSGNSMTYSFLFMIIFFVASVY